jgi:hypothetical protein
VAQRSLHQIAGPTDRPLPESRLAFRRAFIRYYLALQSPVIADPTEVFEACYEYLSVMVRQLGPTEFMRRLDDETTHFMGHAEQEIRRQLHQSSEILSFDDLEDRVREVFESALGRLRSQTGEWRT